MKVYVETLYHYSCEEEDCKGYHTISDKPPSIGNSIMCPWCKKEDRLNIIQYPSGHSQIEGTAKKADLS